MDQLFDRPLISAPGRGEAWVFSLGGWPVLYGDCAGAAVNDLRSTLAFGHQVWFDRANRDLLPGAIAGRTTGDARVVVGTRTVAVITIDRGRPTHVEVPLLDPWTDAVLLSREGRYRQLELPSGESSLGANGLGR